VLMGPAIIDAILSPALLQRHPEFLQNFWVVHENTWKLLSGLPSFLVPKPRAAANVCLNAIKSWHAWARSQSDPAEDHPSTKQSDAFWGSKHVRERQNWVGDVSGFTRFGVGVSELIRAGIFHWLISLTVPHTTQSRACSGSWLTCSRIQSIFSL
jgi:hypothetical protein